MDSKFKPLWDLHQQIIKNPSIRNNAAKAAVVAVIYQDNLVDKIILIKRNEYEGHHSGQMAFPGGKIDSDDHTIVDAAVREVYEEIGLKLSPIQLKPLMPQWLMVSNYWVQPFYTIVDKKPNLILNKREINCIFEIPLSFFINPKNLGFHELIILNDKYLAPRFEYKNQLIWGATAMFLYQMFHLEETKILF